MKIPFLTRLLWIKERQLLLEENILIRLDILIKLHGGKNGK